VQFFKAVALRQEVVKYFYWPILNEQYSDVARFPFYAIPKRLNTSELHDLITQLSKVPKGVDLPEQIDDEFLRMAKLFRQETPVYAQLGVPLIRAGVLWGARDSNFNVRWPKALEWFFGPLSQFYKISIGIGSLGILVLAIFMKHKFLITFAIAAIIATLGRTAFLAATTSLEMRYLVHGIPLLEALSFIGLGMLPIMIVSFYEKLYSHR
jgi:hypothetical protein